MQDYITNNFHGISGMRSTSYMLPGRMYGGRIREKSPSFRGLCIKQLHTHFFMSKIQTRKTFPKSVLRSGINSKSMQEGLAFPATAQLKTHTLALHCLQGVTTGTLFQPTLAQSHPKLFLMQYKVMNLSL